MLQRQAHCRRSLAGSDYEYFAETIQVKNMRTGNKAAALEFYIRGNNPERIDGSQAGLEYP